MKFKRSALVFLMVVTILVSLFSFPVSAAGSTRALLIESTKPWGEYTNDNLLNNLVSSGHITGYDIFDISVVAAPDFDLSIYKVIIISDSQGDNFYDQYTAGVNDKFEAYASAGGTILFGACTQGYAFTTHFLGDVQTIWQPESNNSIADANSPVLSGSLSSNNSALTDADFVGNWCSHTTIVEASLPAGADIITRGTVSNAPTLAEFSFGSGHIIISCLTWEIAYAYSWVYAVKAYDDLFLYALSDLQAPPTGLIGVAPAAYGGLDGKITGTTKDMEYKLSTDTTYLTASDVETTGLAAGTYDVRLSERDGFFTGTDAIVTIPDGPNASQMAPVGLAGIAPSSYAGSDGKITGTTTAMEYKLSTDSIYKAATDIEVLSLAAGTYNVRFAAKTGFNAGADATIVVADGPNAAQTAPTGLIMSSSSGGADGKISGTTPSMEFKLSTATGYIKATGTEITGLVAGVYYVRFAAKPGFDASPYVTLVVSEVLAATITPTATPTVAPTATPTATPTAAAAGVAKTGEHDNNAVWGMVLLAAAAAMTGIFVWNVKRKNASAK